MDDADGTTNEEVTNVMRRRDKLPYKGPLIRNRRIFSCQRCYNAKRKCDKGKPSCSRCIRAKAPCLYFSLVKKNNKVIDVAVEQEKKYIEIDKSKPNISTKHSLNNILNADVGSYANHTHPPNDNSALRKFFPYSMFSVYDNQSDLLLINDLEGNEISNLNLGFFDYSKLVAPFDSPEFIKSKIPSKIHSDYLVRHFFDFIRPFMPIIESDEFFSEYEKYWENPETYKNLEFWAIFYSILFCSCTNLIFLKKLKNLNLYRTRKDNLMFEIDLDEIRDESFQCIENIRHMLHSDIKPSLSIIVSLSLIYYIGLTNGLVTSIQISNLVKLAEIYRLSDPKEEAVEEENDEDDDEVEPSSRNIIYSFVCYLDGLSSYFTGSSTNINYEIFPYKYQKLFLSGDIHLLFLAGELQNIKVYNRILFEYNKLEASTDKDFAEIETLYLDTITLINQLNKTISLSKQGNKKYKNLLITDIRLKMRECSLLLSALKYYKNVPQMNISDSNILIDLVLQSMLLINESAYKIRLSMDVIKESVWHYRFPIPFKSLYIILSHILKYPKDIVNFTMISKEMEYTTDSIHCQIDFLNGDIRLKLVDDLITTLSSLFNFWPSSILKRYENIIKFRNFVYDEIKDKDENQLKTTENLMMRENPPENSKNTDELNDKASNEGLFEFLQFGSKYWFDMV